MFLLRLISRRMLLQSLRMMLLHKTDEFDGVGVRNRLLYYLVIKLMMLLKKRMTLDEVDDVS